MAVLSNVQGGRAGLVVVGMVAIWFVVDTVCGSGEETANGSMKCFELCSIVADASIDTVAWSWPTPAVLSLVDVVVLTVGLRGHADREPT
jgi:hypothetical protein